MIMSLKPFFALSAYVILSLAKQLLDTLDGQPSASQAPTRNSREKLICDLRSEVILSSLHDFSRIPNSPPHIGHRGHSCEVTTCEPQIRIACAWALGNGLWG